MARIAVIASIKLVVSYIIDFINYIFCRKKRRRKISATDVPLSAIEVVPGKECQVTTSDWGAWDDKYQGRPTTINEHIQFYRMQKKEQYILQSNPEIVEEENPIDLFKDMEPEITPQPTIVLQSNENNHEPNMNSRIFTYDAIPVKENELGTWEDEQNNWDVGIDENIIRKENRRLERERRLSENARKKMEKERTKPPTLLSKIH